MKKGNGMKIERLFTKKGEDPFSTAEYERRSSVIRNPDGSIVFEMNDKDYSELMKASKKVAQLLDKKLSVKRTALVMEGMGVNHAHIKLYPIHGLDKKFKETWAKEKIFFEEYEGYISTQLGPEKSIEELNKIAEIIKK